MLRRTPTFTAAILAAGLLAFSLIERDGGKGAGRNVEVPAKGTPSLRIGVTSAADLALGRPETVTFRSAWNGRAVIDLARVLTVGGPPERLVAVPAVLQRGQLVKVVLPLGTRGRAELGGCDRLYLRATVASAEGSAGRTVPLIRAAPDCKPFFSRTSFWNVGLAPVSRIDPLSSSIVATLVGDIGKELREHYYPTVNTADYSVPIYTVRGDQIRVPVVLDTWAPYADGLRRTFETGVPIPPSARPAAGSDGHLVVWQPAGDVMWELWRARRVMGIWHAAYGGRIDHASGFYGRFYNPSGIELGATASSLALAGGLITLADIKRGRIDHALAMAVPDPRQAVWALPASRSDGGNPSPSAIPEGAQFRLPASLDIRALHLSPFVSMLAYAAQRYGIFVRDGAGTTVFYAEDPSASGVDPYPTMFGSDPAFLAAFPWQQLQVLRMSLRTWGGQSVSEQAARPA